MGFFKKNKNKNNNVENKDTFQNIETTQNNELEVVDFNNNSEIEILDLEKSESNEKIINPKEASKENKLLIVIVVVLILFVIFLPTITGIFSKKSIFSYNNQIKEITDNKTVDGMLEIGKEEGTITVKNIRFYNVSKRSNNNISLIYLPESSIKDVNTLGIYIELYNSNKILINRIKFTSDDRLERKIQGTYTFSVNDDVYRQAKYAKVVIIKDEEFNIADDTLICTNEFTDETYKVEYKITYNFSTNGLVNYQVVKEAKPINGEEISDDFNENSEEIRSNKYQESFKKEANEINKTNTEDLEYSENYLKYTIELLTLDLGRSNYNIRYSQGSIKRQVKLNEEANKWVCK